MNTITFKNYSDQIKFEFGKFYLGIQNETQYVYLCTEIQRQKYLINLSSGTTVNVENMLPGYQWLLLDSEDEFVVSPG